MKDKILFVIRRDMIYFSIAKSLQEKYDCDLFAIIETTDRPKKFFQEQDIVRFQKVWYFNDCVSIKKTKPDMEYLKSFEEKYGIRLWSIAYSERKFYTKYNPYHIFTYDEILCLLEQECRLFESILDEVRPDFLIIKIPDFHHFELLYEIANARGIKTLMLNLANFGGRWMITQNASKLDLMVDQLRNNVRNRTIEELQDYQKTFNFLKEVNEYVDLNIRDKRLIPKWTMFKSILLFLLASGDNNDRSRFLDHGKTRLKAIINAISFLLKRKYRQSYIDKNFIHEIPKDEKFVYFPMHVEPEATLLITAPFYTNQLEVITNIAKSLPVGYKLYVKEHPIMKLYSWRNISFYKQIMELPNVGLIHPSIISSEIMQKCSLVITITGNSGLEAAFYEKPSIVFGDVYYSNLSSVSRIKNYKELPQVIASSLKRKVNLSELNNYVNLIDNISFEFNFMVFSDKTYPFHGTFVPIIEVPLSKMKTFLEKHNSVFEKLALEFIKKIKQYKEYERRNPTALS